MEKLPKRFKQKWIKALLSGDYGQAQETLALDDENYKYGKMCCLAVAEHICGQGIEDMHVFNYPKDLHEPKSPKILQEDFIVDKNGKGKNIVSKLSLYNDGGKSFKWIASYIERYL